MSDLLIHSDAEYELSPYAARSTMSDEEYQKLTRQIVADGGPRVPTVLHEGRVLVYPESYRVCIENGITPEFRQFGDDPDDGDDPAEFALRQSPNALSKQESDRLYDCEVIIERGLSTFVAVGNALLEVRERKLWRAGYASFDDWAQQRFDFGRRHADRTIAATQVVGLLDGAVEVTPRSEAVARELVPLREQPDELKAAWVEVLVEHGERPTAAQTHEVVERHLPEKDVPVMEPASGSVQQGTPLTADDYAAEADAVKPDDPNRDDEPRDKDHLDDWGSDDEGSSRKQDTAGTHTILGFLDQVPQLPSAIALADVMTPDQKRMAATLIPGAQQYLETVLRAVRTGK